MKNIWWNILQTTNKTKSLALSAEAWATMLPCLLMWEKVWASNEPEIWPTLEREELSIERALITTSESPLKVSCKKPNSAANITARHAARNSRISTEAGWWIFSANAAITSPTSFQITIPIPASVDFGNKAPSKFTLTAFRTRGDHLTRGWAHALCCVWTQGLSEIQSTCYKLIPIFCLMAS